MKKRRILSAALVLCLVAILAFGSLAYFTASDSVTNKFMTATSIVDPGNPDDPGKELFAVALYETDITKTDNSTTDTGNTYENILPGVPMTKDPTVENTGLYNQYVRVQVTITKYAAWKAACAEHNVELSSIFGTLGTGWTLSTTAVEDTTADTITYTFYQSAVLEPEDTATVFETVTIPAAFTLKNMKTLTEFNIDIVAQAIQSDNNGTDAVSAFANWTE